MIIEFLFSLILELFNFILEILPDIPNMPEDLTNALNNYTQLIFDNSSVVSFFLPMNIVKIAIPLVIVIINFDYIYNAVIWILKKIPMLGIE